MLVLKLLNKYFHILSEQSSKRVDSHGAQYELFGTFAVINYIIPYFMWSPSTSNNYTLLICLRLIAGILCFVLIINDFCKEFFREHLPLYWHFTLLYCLPFMATLMLFDSHGESFWLYNMVITLLLLAVLVDWQSFVIILILGIVSGYSFFLAIGENELFSWSADTLYWTSYMCFFSVLIGILFSRNNEKVALEKLNAYKSVSTSIAHEMRTPLSAMFIAAQGVQLYLPILLKAYEIAQKNNVDIPRIDRHKLKILENFPNHFISISRRSLSVIDIFLTKFGIVSNSTTATPINSAKQCVHTAIREFPFYPENQANLINFKEDRDFNFAGNESLVVHIFYNLIKNSIYQIQIAQKGEIEIWFSDIADFNIAHFKDNAAGIKSGNIKKIFDRFYTDTDHGTGIGLAFCENVMSSLGGKIICHSELGCYTEFQMFFPK